MAREQDSRGGGGGDRAHLEEARSIGGECPLGLEPEGEEAPSYAGHFSKYFRAATTVYIRSICKSSYYES